MKKPRQDAQPSATRVNGLERQVAISTIVHNYVVAAAAVAGAIAAAVAAIEIPKALEGHAVGSATAQGTLDR